MIPKTTTYKQFKEKKAKDTAHQTAMEKGQRTLNGSGPAPGETNGGPGPEKSAPHEEEQKQSPNAPRVVPVSALIADRTVDSSAQHDPDIEMKD